MKNHRSAFRQLSWILLSAATLLATACGGGGSASSAEAAAAPARVEITTKAVLLTETGQTKTLSARVLDSTGKEITATVDWESTQPGQISVNSAGQVTALGDGGSGQITARVGALKSAPLMVFHSKVPTGTLLLTDTQIVGEPVETSPNATPSMRNTYSVRLSGAAAPMVGQLVINTEAKIVVGRVQAVNTDASGVHTVTLGLVSMREALPTLNIDETISLSNSEVIIPDAVSAQFDVTRNGSSFTFTPKQLGKAQPLARAQAAVPKAHALGATGTSASGPLGECKTAVDGASGAGSLPISVLPTNPFTVDINPSLQTKFTRANGLERLVVHSLSSFPYRGLWLFLSVGLFQWVLVPNWEENLPLRIWHWVHASALRVLSIWGWYARLGAVAHHWRNLAL
jgi:hypothetical protein